MTTEFRSINGLGNNEANPLLGETGTSLLRLLDGEVFYEDDIDAPRVTGPTGNTLPEPRSISNIVVDQDEVTSNFLNASDWLWQWGQFLDHDLDLSEAGPADSPFAPAPEDFFSIAVAQPDEELPGITEIPAIRIPAQPDTGAGTAVPREQANQITHFIDASNVYGSEDERTEFLREEGTPFLLTTLADNGEILLPRGEEGIENANALGLPAEDLFVGGDPRVNEQIGLTAVHTLLVREHNRLAAELTERLEEGEEELVAAFEDSGLSEEDFLFEAARFIVGAQNQNITYNEFLPILIGEALPEYEGYDPTVDPSVSAEFSAAVYRLGHTLLAENLLRVDEEGNVTEEIALGEAFFIPDQVQEGGVDDLFAGLAVQNAQALDNTIDDGVRNLLFPGATGGTDLASVNIARGREVGLPTYTEVREFLGLSVPADFSEIPATPEVQARLEEAYESVVDIDLWVGAISEAPVSEDALGGELLTAVLVDQFGRSRDGDRFFFEDEEQAAILEIFAPDFENYDTLDEIIELNTEVEIEGSAFFTDDEDGVEFRTINGLGNNIEDPELGETGTSLLRLLDGEVFYEDGIDAPRVTGPTGNTLPEPRSISNIVVDQDALTANFLGASDWLWQWGQFLDHDLDLSEAGPADSPFAPAPEDFFSIAIAQPDPELPAGITEIPAIRVPAQPGTGAGTEVPREQANQITHFIDASNVYGSEDERTEFLREEGTPFLATTAADNGEILLPRGEEGVENANALGLPAEDLFVGGDPRVNEQIGLTAVHTLFVREHNRLAVELTERLEAGEESLVELFEGSGLSEEDFLFESARFIVGATNQNITYNEFLPILIGDALPEYEGYSPEVDPSVSAEFSAAVYRLGHTLLAENLLRVDAEGNVTEEIPLGEAFFIPDQVQEGGVDDLFAGLAVQPAQSLDNTIDDGVRNLLFPGATGGTDLASVNIARGREVGLPTYTEVREFLGLSVPADFSEIPATEEVQERLAEAYESVQDIDLWVGAISEAPVSEDALGGELLTAVLVDQFTRSRDGDRFYFEEETQAGILEILAPDFESYNNLDEVIELNSEAEIEGSAFFIEEAPAVEFRTINGLGNNITEPELGETGTSLLRLLDGEVFYEDGIDAPRVTGPTGNTLPEPRSISNIVVDQDEVTENFLGASDWLWQWGQFLDHDLDLSEAGPADSPFAPAPEDFFSIAVAQPDEELPGITEIPAIRVPAQPGTGAGTIVPREQANQITHFIDASNVYGSEDERTEFLRDGETPFLATTAADNGEILLPRGEEGIENANALGLPAEDLFVGGDPRVNEQIGLTAVHTLLVREHNRVAAELVERFEAGDEALLQAYADSELESEEDFLFEAARFVVGAVNQNITYNEFLPILIGDSLPEYEGYNPDVNPNVSAEFSAAVYRLGHTLLAENLLRTDNEGNVLEEIPLGEAFFIPDQVQTDGVDTLFSGLAVQPAQALDNTIDDGVRNLLFPGATGGTDLASVNIARGREVGLPTYTEVREFLGLSVPADFSEIPATEDVQALLAEAYESVQDIDLWVGAISEAPVSDDALGGELLTAVLVDQFARSRDGDRFYFEQEEQLELLEIFSPEFESFNELDEIIEANSNAEIEGSAFFVAEAPAPDPDPADGLIVGSAGDDVVVGGVDIDAIEDTVLTGAGSDSVDLSVTGANNNIVLAGSDGDTVFASSEDIISGGSGDDEFFTGSLGDETGGNRISGGAGNDSFFVEGSGDRLLGGAGDDTFIVGEGSDNILSGGDGADTFIFGEATAEVNTITDFDAEIDILQIDGIAELAADGDTISSGGVDFLVLVGVEDASALLPAAN